MLLAGTYNAHPVPTAAAIATIEQLMADNGELYSPRSLGVRLAHGVERIVAKLGITATLARQGSAFCLYFMDHAPVDWHDILEHHDFASDSAMRRNLVDNGIYFFPLAVKQGSISAAHTEADVDTTLERWEVALNSVAEKIGVPA